MVTSSTMYLKLIDLCLAAPNFEFKFQNKTRTKTSRRTNTMTIWLKMNFIWNKNSYDSLHKFFHCSIFFIKKLIPTHVARTILFYRRLPLFIFYKRMNRMVLMKRGTNCRSGKIFVYLGHAIMWYPSIPNCLVTNINLPPHKHSSFNYTFLRLERIFDLITQFNFLLFNLMWLSLFHRFLVVKKLWACFHMISQKIPCAGFSVRIKFKII